MRYIQKRVGHTITTVFSSTSVSEINLKLVELITTEEGDFYLSDKPTKDWKKRLGYKPPARGATRLHNLRKPLKSDQTG